MSEEAQRFEGGLPDPIETEATATAASSEVKGLVDSTGKPIPAYRPAAKGIVTALEATRARAGEIYVQGTLASEEEIVVLSIPRKEFERLNVKTNEVLVEAALAQERIGKDQQEIEKLKTETRAMLTSLRAA